MFHIDNTLSLVFTEKRLIYLLRRQYRRSVIEIVPSAIGNKIIKMK